MANTLCKQTVAHAGWHQAEVCQATLDQKLTLKKQSTLTHRNQFEHLTLDLMPLPGFLN